MKIIMTDASILTCNEIEISADGTAIIADEYRIVPMCEIVRIIPE